MGTLGWAAGLSAMTRNIAGGITSIIEEAPLNLFRLPLPGSKNDTAGIKSDVQKAKITHKYEGLQEVIKGVSSINTNMMLDVLSEGMNLETDTSTLHLFPGMMKNNKFLLELYKSAINYDAYKKGLEEYEYALTRARINHDGASALTINAALNEYKENYMQEVRRAMTDADRISPKDPRFKEVKRLLKSQMAGEFRLSREAASRLLKDGIRQSVTQGMMSLMNRPEAWMRTTTAILAYRQAEEMGFSEKERNMIAMKSVMRQHQFYSSIYRTFGQGTRMGRVLKSLNHYVAGKLEAMRENVRETRDQYLLFGLKGLDPFRSELKVEGERFQENHAHKLANLIATSVVMDNIGQYLWGLQYVVNPVSSVFLGGLRLMLKAFDEDRKNKSDKNPVTWQQVYFAASAAMQLKMGTGSSFLVSVPYMALTGTPSDAVGVTNPKTGKIVGTVAHELTNYNSDYLQGWNNLIKAATGFGINRQGPGKMFGHYYSPLGLILPGGNDLLNFFIDEEEEKKEHKEMMKKTLPRRREEKKKKEERLKASNVRTSPIGEYIFGK
jgi:hypothetical protein